MRTVQVPLGNRTYTIVVDRKLLTTLGERCGNFGLAGRCAVITDKNVAPRYAKNALYSLKKVGIDPILITIPAGEKISVVNDAILDDLGEAGAEFTIG